MTALSRETLAVLKYRDFRIVLAERTLAPLAFSFSLVGVSFAALQSPGGSTTHVAIVLTALMLPSLVVMLAGGVAADRFRPQAVMAVGYGLMVLGEGGVGILFLTGNLSLPLMVILQVCTGSGSALFQPASAALLPRVVPESALQQANALTRVAGNAARIGGITVGGVVVAAVGPGWGMLISALSLLCTVPLLALLRVGPIDRADETPTKLWTDLAAGWDEFRSRPWVWASVLQYTLVNGCWYGGAMVLGPAVAETYFGGAKGWGFLNAAASIGLLIGGAVALKVMPRRPVLVMTILAFPYGLSCLVLGLDIPLWVACLVWLGADIGTEVGAVGWNVLLAKEIPAEALGRVSSYDLLGSAIAMPIGALIAGPLSTRIGLRPTEVGAFALIAISVPLVLLSRQVRTIRMPESAAESAEPETPERV